MTANMRTERGLARSAAGALFATVAAGSWDAWWHTALGRESFWSPPHVLLYLSTIIAVACGIFGWRRFRSSLWKRFAFVLLLVPASAPFDELWHRAFGVEPINSPIIVWSPPHLLLIGALIAALWMLIPILDRDRDPVARHLFMAMTFAAMLVLALFPVAPLEPTGPWHLLGFWGVAVEAAAFIFVLLLARRVIGGVGAATSVAVMSLIVQMMAVAEHTPTDSAVPSHAHPPVWLSVFAVLLASIVIDLMKKHASLRGALAAAAWSATLYGFAPIFFPPEFRYGGSAIITTVVAAGVGGLIAALVSSRTAPKRLS